MTIGLRYSATYSYRGDVHSRSVLWRPRGEDVGGVEGWSSSGTCPGPTGAARRKGTASRGSRDDLFSQPRNPQSRDKPIFQ